MLQSLGKWLNEFFEITIKPKTVDKKDIFEKEYRSSNWSCETNSIWILGSKLFDELQEPRIKSQIIMGTIIVAIAIDENPYLPVLEIPDHPLNGQRLYCWNKDQIFDWCELKIFSCPTWKEFDELFTNLIFKVGDAILQCNIPFLSNVVSFANFADQNNHEDPLVLNFPYLKSYFENVGYFRDLHKKRVATDIENTTQIPRDLIYIIFHYNCL